MLTFDNVITLIKNGFRALTQHVKTLDAALLKWKLLTYRNESAHNVKTNNSPPRSDKTSLSVAMNAIWAQSRLIFTPSCGSDEDRRFVRLNSNTMLLFMFMLKFHSKLTQWKVGAVISRAI